MSHKLSDYQYDLPEELIACRPPAKREDARMLVLERSTGSIHHSRFAELGEYLQNNDLLLLNDSRVIPARLVGDSGRIEIMLLEQSIPTLWKAMVRPGRKFREGASFTIAGTTVTVMGVLDDGTRLLEFASPPDLGRHGEMPIPPYFNRRADEEDKERYQTVFARDPGSVAAPTAGLHFTPEILASLPHAFVTLHVGAGTFQPVKTEELSDHVMHRERYSVPSDTANQVNAARLSGGRIVAVGTTAARVLESCAPGELVAGSGTTGIFIRPPYRFHRTDVLLTNFHLPGSTLLMLVSALAGRELILEAYAEAVRERYRFFSYGDCMLIM